MFSVVFEDLYPTVTTDIYGSHTVKVLCTVPKIHLSVGHSLQLVTPKKLHKILYCNVYYWHVHKGIVKYAFFVPETV